MDDPIELDRQHWHCGRVLAQARAILRQRDTGSDVPPVAIEVEQMEALAASADPSERALAELATALRAECLAFRLERALAGAWRAAPAPGEPSLRQRLDALLAERSAARREAYAHELGAHAAPVQAAAFELWERRFELASAHGTEPPGGALACHAAERLLARSDDLASVRRTAPWCEGVAAALARDAAEGWPATPSSRWLGEVFAPGLVRGLRIELGPAPRVLGGASYARALGSFGVALLEASARSPYVLHLRPHGPRRATRRALFAALAAETSFAVRVLGLGKERARAQRRALLWALFTALRIDALRALCSASLRRGLEGSSARDAQLEGFERYAELGERVLGSAPPRALFALLPALSSGDGVRLCGALAAPAELDLLIERFDEDWFKNPRAAEHLRAADAMPEELQALDAPTLDAAIDALVARFENALG